MPLNGVQTPQFGSSALLVWKAAPSEKLYGAEVIWGTHQFETLPSITVASSNMLAMLFRSGMLDTSQEFRYWLNESALRNILRKSLTLETSQLSKGWLNEVALLNISFIRSTLETSQVPMGTLNTLVDPNISDMIVTWLMSHPLMSPLNETAL